MKIHFIGIGGIGVSALARYFLARGDEVSGSDSAASEITADLEKMGIKIFVGHKAENISQSDCVIFSAAVQDINLELVEARRQGIKTQKYAQALGEITKEKYTIAVSGMHGKSTTTAMIGLMLEKAGLDPTVIVGTRLKEWSNSNFRSGKSKYLVIEADEYDRSFLNYWPKVLVLLNIEEEHLDTYTGGLADIMKTFEEYVGHLDSEGVLIFNEEDNNIATLINTKSQFLISKQIQNPKFKIQKYNAGVVSGLKLRVPGRHNISNANAALAVARLLGIDEKIAVESLNNFSGAWRRMEYKGEINGAKVYDDYGHHPTEIAATLNGAKELVGQNGKLWCVFQPHQYHRTFDLFEKFIGAFSAADKVVLLPIYSVAGREDEEIKKQVSSEKLALRLQAQGKKEDVVYIEDFNKAGAYLKERLQARDVCLIMGAGDIYKLTNLLIKA